MSLRAMGMAREEDGQAAVEFVALLPLLAALALLAWQALIAGEAWWLASAAARDGARAAAVGGDVREAAEAVLPARLRAGLAVRATGGDVRVRVQIPRAVPGVRLGAVEARASMERQS